MDRVTLLFTAINQAAKNPGKVLEDRVSKIKTRLKRDAAFWVLRNERTLERAEKALSNFESDHSWASDFLESFDTLRVNASPYFLPLLEVQRIKAEKLLEKTGEDARFNLERHIASIKAETAFFNKKLKDWNEE
jgi:hypothetical protein